MIAIDSSNSLPDHAMFGRLEDGSWFMWKIHQFTLAKLKLEIIISLFFSAEHSLGVKLSLEQVYSVS